MNILLYLPYLHDGKNPSHWIHMEKHLSHPKLILPQPRDRTTEAASSPVPRPASNLDLASTSAFSKASTWIGGRQPPSARSVRWVAEVPKI